MPIIELQRRLREIGRIRIGEQVPMSNGKTRPAKLDVFRLTSKDRRVVDAAAQQFGGKIESWASPDGDAWQVKTNAKELTVVVPPQDMAFSQWYEAWTAGGCQRRCDGQFEFIGEQGCVCEPDNRECAIHTRLSVILPDLPGLGVWRLDTSGYYAAVELGGVVEIAAAYAARGQMLPARLRLEQRSVKRPGKDGKPETRRFAVPTLDLDVNPMQLASGTAPAIGNGAPASFQPVPVAELPSAPVSSVAEQVASVNDPGAAKPRKNAATPIPPTGLQPRTAAAAEGDEPAVSDLAPPEVQQRIAEAVYALDNEDRTMLATWWPQEWFPASVKRRNLTVDQAEAVEAYLAALKVPAEDGPFPDVTAKQIGTAASKAFPLDDVARGKKTETRDRLRYALAYAVSAGERWHSDDLTLREKAELLHRLEQIIAGGITFSFDDTAVTFFRSSNGEEVTVRWDQLDAPEEQVTADA